MTQNLISYPDLPDFSWLYYERIAARFGLNDKVLKKVSFDIFYQCFYCLCWDIDIHTLLFHHSSSVLCQYFNFYFLKPILKLLLCHINMKKIPVALGASPVPLRTPSCSSVHLCVRPPRAETFSLQPNPCIQFLFFGAISREASQRSTPFSPAWWGIRNRKVKYSPKLLVIFLTYLPAPFFLG